MIHLPLSKCPTAHSSNVPIVNQPYCIQRTIAFKSPSPFDYNMRLIPERELTRPLPDGVLFDTPMAMVIILKDIAYFSRCVDILLENANIISSRSEVIPLTYYIKLAQHIVALRSWSNYIRNLTVDELEKSDYDAEWLDRIVDDLDSAMWQMEFINMVLNGVQEDAKLTKEQSNMVARAFVNAGETLRIMFYIVPAAHRVKDLTHDPKFKLDVANRPIRTLHLVCVKALTLMAELDAKTTPHRTIEKEGKLWDLEDRLRHWGVDRVDGEAPFDSYIQIGDDEITAGDAQDLYDTFLVILCIQSQLLSFVLLFFA